MKLKNRDKERRTERQTEAKVRQAAHEDLSIKEKLNKTRSRLGFSSRERERLLKIVWKS